MASSANRCRWRSAMVRELSWLITVTTAMQVFRATASRQFGVGNSIVAGNSAATSAKLPT